MARSNSENATFGPTGPDASARAHVPPPVSMQHQYTVSALEAENYADFFEPAIERPPSPGRIRALSNKVKQASVSERHVSQQTTSSGTSSLHSYTSRQSLERRPSWEQALESFSLSRKSSIKSTSSSMPSKERPESVQAIGKAIFNRKSKLRRESLGTSGGSIYPPEAPPEVPVDRIRAASVSKENILSAMSIFNRRKTVQAGEDTSKKLAISSPFNFQHVAQIQRDELPAMERAERKMLQGDLASVRTPPAATVLPSRGLPADDLKAPNFSSRATRFQDDDDAIPPDVVPHSRESSISRPSSFSKSPRWVKQTKSQDHLRGKTPPRPPRSPTEQHFDYFDQPPPMPPMRHPSRPSIPRRDSEALGNMGPDRHYGLNSFRFPTAVPMPGEMGIPSPGSPSSPTASDSRRFSRVFLPTEEPNWPLSCPLNNASVEKFGAALPDLPEEEEEQPGLTRKPRNSMHSTNSSLKGSVSVPALRNANTTSAYQAAHDRSYSRDSVVLGQFDIGALRRAVEGSTLQTHLENEAEPLRRDSWEDVIDYCYEHEMEADDDYDWHRPSVELQKEPKVFLIESEDDCDMSSRPTSDVSALDPLSARSSTSHASLTIHASAAKSPTSANFSLPRARAPKPTHLHVRTGSKASFTEAQGFTLSPSFLIPTDYHQELLAARSEQYDPESIAHAVGFEEQLQEIVADNSGNSSSLFVPARASGSTTASNVSSVGRTVSERHISGTSTNTDYTRLTMSTMSADLDSFIFKEDLASPVVEEQQQAHFEFGDLHKNIAPTSPAIPVSPHSRSFSAADLLLVGGKKASQTLSRDNTHSSDSNLAGLQHPSSSTASTRARSRTLSSTPGQFSLFPAMPKGPRI